jgi:hypothetical protein
VLLSASDARSYASSTDPSSSSVLRQIRSSAPGADQRRANALEGSMLRPSASCAAAPWHHPLRTSSYASASMLSAVETM